jgi:hypothetical protein
MTSAMIREQIEIDGQVFDLNIFAYIRWFENRPYVDGDIDFQFTDPEDDTADNYELVCRFLDDNHSEMSVLLEDKAEQDGEPVGWNT